MRTKSHLGKRALSLWLAALLVAVMLPVQAQAADADAFVSGPYLLAPKSTGMVVVWETEKPVKSSISYGVDAANMQTLDVPVEEGVEYKGESMHMYRARLTDLLPNTRYQYEVKLEGGQTMSGSFKTLHENPEQIKFVIVSDTHKFETAEQVGAAIAEFEPDFILHTGDMVEGTGTQKEQFTFWFKNNGDFLRNYPVLYNSGNHDFGPYFDEYVTGIQKEQYHSNENGRNISFNYGNTHFAMMDSNPWSLFELNAASAGTVDASTKATVDESLNWLKEDLASAEAKNATFRVLTMHHPYEDELSRKYIPPIIEPANVNVMFAGHTHVYGRTASPDPARGTRTLYVTQGDARIGDSKIDKGTEGERIDEELPEVLATGKGDMLEVTIAGELLTYENIGLKDGKETVMETIALTAAAPKLQFDAVSITPDSVLSNGAVTVSAKVTNTGDGLAAATFQINDNGTDRYLYTFGKPGKERVVALDPGESATLSAELTLDTLGKHTLKFAGISKEIDVQFRSATFAYDNLRIKLGDGEVSDLASNRMYAKADVRNIGNEAGTAGAMLYIDGNPVLAQQVPLEAGQSKAVEFVYDFGRHGDYQVHIGDTADKTVSIAGVIQGTPIVKDLSGLGNDGILRGAPTLVQYDGGYGISLDGVKDYVEIPDRQNYTVDDGVTGMVWANVDRLAADGEWDHNPLLMKGASISYGTNYLYRMAIRATGKITYGIGFDDDNGEFFWNDDDADTAGVKLGQWVQYTGAFDRATGGVSWQNTAQSGEIDPPAFDSPIKNWPGEPMYAGISYHRHLLSGRNRGRTHTNLTGDLGQIRFYTAKLSEASNKSIYNAPSAKGPQSESLVVWLDFDPKNMVTQGTHTTEWTALSGAAQTLDYSASIPGASSIHATIEISDDGTTAKESKEFTLEDGQNTLDLSGLAQGKQFRIITKFVSSVGEQSTDIPKLQSYTMHAGNMTSWGTLADWNRGTFTDAAGYEPTDIFKDYAVDFDDYSGAADVKADTATTVSAIAPIPNASAGNNSAIGSDIAASHWARATLLQLVADGVIKGDAENGFVRPDAGITREEIASALTGALDLPAPNNAALQAADRSSAWAAGVLLAAKEKGILNGDEHGYLNGQDSAARLEVAVMVARAAGISSDDLSLLSPFTDGADVPEWAQKSIAGLLEKGLLKGYEDHTLRLNSMITRAEAFTLLAGIL